MILSSPVETPDLLASVGITPESVAEHRHDIFELIRSRKDRFATGWPDELPERLAYWYRTPDLTDGDYRLIPEPDKGRVLVDLGPLVDRQALAPK